VQPITTEPKEISMSRPRPVPPPAKPSRPAERVVIAAPAKGLDPPEPAAATVATPPVPLSPQVRYRCGHTRPVAEIEGANCPPCRAKKIQEKNRLRHDKWLANKAANPGFEVGRLPAGSAKRLLWNGVEWYGVLDVPGCPTFEFRASGEKACFHRLDGLYREWLAQQPTAGVEP
jgi:hypothetical protein